ncbi:VOC family protein [Bradyrhizobium sp. SZCCHNRI3052]|uniref:VOC family protein n=1 Tax=unclassified Bradyrhizobium TaxID=2631580 RepID=UPI002916A01F|nr:VOC family protein [Bradyrhizobium sp. SZCCHNRI3052]
MLTRIDYVAVYVADQRAALDFYVDTLGFELRHCSPGGIINWGYDLTVGLPGQRMMLQLTLRPPGDTSRSTPIMLSCTDLEQTYHALLAKGVRFHCHLNGGLEFVSFYDPDGNEFYISDNSQNWIDENALARMKQGVPDGP